MCHDIYYLCIVFFYRIGTLGIALLETNENGGHVLTLAKMSLAFFLSQVLVGFDWRVEYEVYIITHHEIDRTNK